MQLPRAWRQRRRGGMQGQDGQGSGAAEPASTPREPPGGCGWFDSSLELRLGLAVIEHPEIPLDFAVQALLGLDATVPPGAALQARRPVR